MTFFQFRSRTSSRTAGSRRGSLAPWLAFPARTLYDLGSAVCVPVLAVVDARMCTGGTETTECGLYQEASGLRVTGYRLYALESTSQSLEPRSQRPLYRVLFLAHGLTGAPQTWKVVRLWRHFCAFAQCLVRTAHSLLPGCVCGYGIAAYLFGLCGRQRWRDWVAT